MRVALLGNGGETAYHEVSESRLVEIVGQLVEWARNAGFTDECIAEALNRPIVRDEKLQRASLAYIDRDANAVIRYGGRVV